MIYKRLQILRKQNGMSQKEMAEKLHKSPSAYNRMEKGEIKIPLDELSDIADALDCSINDLLKDLRSFNNEKDEGTKSTITPHFQKKEDHEMSELFNRIMEFQLKREQKMEEFMLEVLKQLKNR